MNAETSSSSRFELRFQSRGNERRAMAFPCDATGNVNLDALSARALNDYLFARTVIGRDFQRPTVQARA